MKHRERLSEILETLEVAGFEAGEVFLKAGRSRRFEIGPRGRVNGASEEIGWAVRATTARASFFCTGTGLPDPGTTWPEPDGRPLQLPPREPIPSWTVPADLGQALTSETEATALLEGIERALVVELAGSRLIGGLLEEGTSESWVSSSSGIGVEFRSRAASLIVEAAGPWPGTSSASMSFAARHSRQLQPMLVAERLANRLLLTQQGSSPKRERGEILLASPVAARILCSLTPLWLGRRGEQIASRLRDQRGRIGSSQLTVVDDGRLPGGLLESPVDGEGRPAGPVLLVEEGRYQRSLRDWRGLPKNDRNRPGCFRRHSWRDLPHPGLSHLFCQSGSTVAVGDLLGSISRGYYLVEPLGAGVFDFDGDRFRLPVCGFSLQRGGTLAPLSRVWLEGGIGALLRGIQAVARDLTFHPHGAAIGAPTLLVSGVGISADC